MWQRGGPLCVANRLLTATTVTKTMRGDLNASNEQRGKVGDWWWRMSNATTPCCFPTPALPHFLLSSLPPGLSPTEEKKDGWRLSNNAHVAECLISASMQLLRHFLLISKSRGPFLTRSSDFLLLFFYFSIKSFDLHWKNGNVFLLDTIVEQYHLSAKGNEITVFPHPAIAATRNPEISNYSPALSFLSSSPFLLFFHFKDSLTPTGEFS